MYPRSICPKRHALETKVVTGGILGLWKKGCSECGARLSAGITRHSCKKCSFHLCDTCYRQPACPVGHPLKVHRVSGGWLGGCCTRNKRCSKCCAELKKRLIRHSCKACNYHLCGSCCGALKGTTWPPPGAPPPSPPLAPEPLQTTSGRQMRACEYGAGCYRNNATHLAEFAHPGDHYYRNGLVVFEKGRKPEFISLWQLFQYFDAEESGHLSRAEFADASVACGALMLERPPPASTLELATAWQEAGGPAHDYLSFNQFATWTQEFLGLSYPLGLEASGDQARLCRFMTSAGTRCTCMGFAPASQGSLICKCGHKTSLHRSEQAQGSFSLFSSHALNPQWAPDEEGLIQVANSDTLAELERMLRVCHKADHNWTRDRGCKLHGVNGPGCSLACASKHRARVPSGFKLLTAFRNQNRDLWQKYCVLKTAIAEECSSPCGVSYEPRAVATSGIHLDPKLDSSGNEWLLFHGTSMQNCMNICSSNFKVGLAGSGATWKDPGNALGTPLYGFGIYLAEHITKADEYSEQVPEDDAVLPEDDPRDFYTVLVCRVLGGRSNVVTTNEIEVAKLKADVFDGPFHSVFGDRVTSLGKPYREIVVYDKDQCYPDFLLVYSREGHQPGSS